MRPYWPGTQFNFGSQQVLECTFKRDIFQMKSWSEHRIMGACHFLPATH